MEGLGWTLFFIVSTPIVLLLLFTWWCEAGFRREYPRRVGSKQSNQARVEVGRTPVPAPIVAKPKPKPARELPGPGYLRRWDAARRFHEDDVKSQWEREFAREELRM